MSEVLFWPSFLISILEIDAIASGKILGDDDTGSGVQKSPVKACSASLLCPHLCSKLGIKKDYGGLRLPIVIVKHQTRRYQGNGSTDRHLPPLAWLGKGGKKKLYLDEKNSKKGVAGDDLLHDQEAKTN